MYNFHCKQLNILAKYKTSTISLRLNLNFFNAHFSNTFLDVQKAACLSSPLHSYWQFTSENMENIGFIHKMPNINTNTPCAYVCLFIIFREWKQSNLYHRIDLRDKHLSYAMLCINKCFCQFHIVCWMYYRFCYLHFFSLVDKTVFLSSHVFVMRFFLFHPPNHIVQ